MSNNESGTTREMTFEEAISALEQSVRRLEGNSLGLEQSLEEYSKAVGYVSLCQQRLSHAKQKIEQLKSISKSGEIVAAGWEESEPKPDTPTTRRRKSE